MKPLFTIIAMLAGCTAVVRTPGWNTKLASEVPTFNEVYLTSGRFNRPYHVVGEAQLTQTGYRWLFEMEVVEGADPNSLLYYIAKVAHDSGADGVQHLEIVDENPVTPADKTAKQVSTAVSIIGALAQRRAPTALANGDKTSYRVRGELIKFE